VELSDSPRVSSSLAVGTEEPPPARLTENNIREARAGDNPTLSWRKPFTG
jgi:hypothetical protein